MVLTVTLNIYCAELTLQQVCISTRVRSRKTASANKVFKSKSDIAGEESPWDRRSFRLVTESNEDC